MSGWITWWLRLLRVIPIGWNGSEPYNMPSLAKKFMRGDSSMLAIIISQKVCGWIQQTAAHALFVPKRVSNSLNNRHSLVSRRDTRISWIQNNVEKWKASRKCCAKWKTAQLCIRGLYGCMHHTSRPMSCKRQNCLNNISLQFVHFHRGFCTFFFFEHLELFVAYLCCKSI